MCGRYDNLIARDAYRGLFRAGRLPASNFPLRYNIAPTDQIPIVRVDPRDGEREVVMARWGLIPFWMKEKPKIPHINARAETATNFSSFAALRHHRGLRRRGLYAPRSELPALSRYPPSSNKRPSEISEGLTLDALAGCAALSAVVRSNRSSRGDRPICSGSRTGDEYSRIEEAA
jgi:SOS response associated peptidase (SRAP)